MLQDTVSDETPWLGERGCMHLSYPSIALFIQRESGQELKQGRNLKAGADAEIIEWYLQLPLMAPSAAFLENPAPPTQE